MMNRKKKACKQLGAVYVELALSILTLLFTCFGAIELMRLSYFHVSLQHVLTQTLRSAAVMSFSESYGRNCDDPNAFFAKPEYQAVDHTDAAAHSAAMAAGTDRAHCIEQEIKKVANDFGIEIDESNSKQIFINTENIDTGAGNMGNSACTSNGGDNAGGSEYYFSICIQPEVNLFLGLVDKLEAVGFARNERYE